MTRRFLLHSPSCSLLLCALLAGCISTNGIAPSSQRADPAALAATRSLQGVTLSPAAWPSQEWWKALGDAQLDQLMAEALAGSPTLAAARARVDATQGTAMIARAKLGSVNSLDIAARRQRNSARAAGSPNLSGRSFNDLRIAWGITYDVDWWGRDNATLEAALGRVKAAEADAAAARLMLSSAIARTYVDLAHDYDQLAIARQALSLRESALSLAQQRIKGGLDAQIDAAWSESETGQARARITQLEEAIALGRNQLAALLGRGPDRGLDIAPPRLGALADAALPSRLPADLVGRRPDIVAARWRIEAALKDIDAARAAFYPNIDLAAYVGLQALGLGELLRSGSHIFGLGPAVSLPLYGGLSRRGVLTEQAAGHDVAVEYYNQLLVDALREVVDQVTTLRSLDAQRRDIEAALASAEKAHELMLKRYQGGLSGRLVVVAAETQLLDRRTMLADLRARRFDAAIGLMLALGGGYEADTAKTTNAAEAAP